MLVEDKSVEFKFKPNYYGNDECILKVWSRIFDRYFKEIFNIDGYKLVCDNLSDDNSIIPEIHPYSKNYYISYEDKSEKTIFSFYIYGQNNCCGAITTSDTYIHSEYKRKKLGTLIQHFKEALAINGRHSASYCTDVIYINATQDFNINNDITPYLPNHKLLLSTGWNIVDKFYNTKSSNVVGMFKKHIVNKKEEEIIMNISTIKNEVVEIKNITIGCDPELFLRDKNSGEFIPSYHVIKGSKEDPIYITDRGHNIQCDNVMVEYGVPPSKTALQFVKNNLLVQEYLQDKVATPNGLELIMFPYAEFTEGNLRDSAASVFGCSSDFDAWKGGRPNIVGRINPLGRSAGGHIHVGYDNHNEKTSQLIVRALDLFISVPLILMEPANKRKEMYGKAGAYRLTSYGKLN